MTNALEDPTVVGGKTVGMLDTILKYSYVDLLLSCFLSTLGIRIQGSNHQH